MTVALKHPFEFYARLPQGLPVVIPNPAFEGKTFLTVVVACKSPQELYDTIYGRGYIMGKEEQRFYDENLERLEEEESLAVWAIEECARITNNIESINFENGSAMSREQMDSMIARHLEGAVDMERSTRLLIKSNLSLQDLQFEREERRHRELVDTMASIKDAVVDADHLGKVIRFGQRHPFLTGLLGPTLIKKLLGQ